MDSEKQSPEDHIQIGKEIAGASLANQIIDKIDNLLSDESMEDQEKIEKVGHIKMQIKYSPDKDFKFKEGVFPIPTWKREKIVNYCDLRIEELKSGLEPVIQTKGEKLKSSLMKYGFFELDMVSKVDDSKLINLVATNKVPYQIAMLNFLGFLQHLRIKHGLTEYKIHGVLASVLDVHKDTIKGNIRSLNPSAPDKTKARYKAYLHIEQVKKDCQSLI